MRVAALYDIHGNLPALEAVLQEIAQANVELLLVGGDVVAGPMPRETLACLLNLARQAIDVGATRAEESPYYLEQIARFIYAGDTPLHIAAAAYETGIAEQLVSRGANVRA